MDLILKVLVGSRANGLATWDSDWDYRGVWVKPTSEILKLGGNEKGQHNIEGNEDNTVWELGHFLSLAVKCNPVILEVLVAPTVESTKIGIELQGLFDFVWNPIDVKNAFLGYSVNQRSRLLENKENRAAKFAVAYTRTVLNAYDLLSIGKFSLEVSKHSAFLPAPYVSWMDCLKDIRNGLIKPGKVIDVVEPIAEEVKRLAADGPFKSKKTEIEPVNEFLLQARKDYW